MPSRPRSERPGTALRANAAEGLSYPAPNDEFVGWPPPLPLGYPYKVFEFAGDFLNCWGDGTTERGPCGEKAGGWFEAEKGVDTGGVATAWLDASLLAVGVAIANERGTWRMHVLIANWSV